MSEDPDFDRLLVNVAIWVSVICVVTMEVVNRFQVTRLIARIIGGE